MIRFALLGSLLIAPLLGAAPAAQRPVSFNRDIRPIMSDTCFHCHGFDAKSREAGMRLDLRAEALKPTKNDLIPIVPGKPDESEIIQRIMDPSDPMPPDTMHKSLTAAQKELFRRWVAEGAVYEAHWAYTPLVKPELPKIENRQSKIGNPIDVFILAQLAEKKIKPSPEAEKSRLLRRVSLDLTGLPPTPAETAAFLADRSRDAYEKQVERLLASPRHGERMAVWWLDIARFSDTVGFHGDQNQRIFPYRDYVINAFNTNKRFDQFTAEQLAGDLLPNPTTEQKIASLGVSGAKNSRFSRQESLNRSAAFACFSSASAGSRKAPARAAPSPPSISPNTAPNACAVSRPRGSAARSAAPNAMTTNSTRSRPATSTNCSRSLPM